MLNDAGDEYIQTETDELGERKVLSNGQLLGGREYRIRTFNVPNRADELFMLATECSRVLGYRDSYTLFNRNKSLYQIIANQVVKDDLVTQEILPYSYKSRQIAIVTARSIFQQFGSRVIVNGRRVRDDYWESRARKKVLTESGLPHEERPAFLPTAVAAATEAATEAASGPALDVAASAVLSGYSGHSYHVWPTLDPDNRSRAPGPTNPQGPYAVVSDSSTILERQTQQERPFSCNLCSQSFDRNHDLKRHKRIHLAVKPYPCGSCDKAFSRRDALKVRPFREGRGDVTGQPLIPSCYLAGTISLE